MDNEIHTKLNALGFDSAQDCGTHRFFIKTYKLPVKIFVPVIFAGLPQTETMDRMFALHILDLKNGKYQCAFTDMERGGKSEEITEAELLNKVDEFETKLAGFIKQTV